MKNSQHELVTSTLVAKLIKYTKLDIKEADIPIIVEAAKHHDIGKIYIPSKILNKPGKLTKPEFEIVKKHTIYGYNLIKNANIDPKMQYYAMEICRHHHERVDGKGYPDGLKGDDIPDWVQITSIADVYEALTSERCYKPAYTKNQALNMLIQGDCGQFNPLILKKCIRYLKAL